MDGSIFAEFRFVYQALNSMANRINDNMQMLQRAHDELEARVKERTKDLAIANEQLQKEIFDREQVFTSRYVAAAVFSLPVDPVYTNRVFSVSFIRIIIVKGQWVEVTRKVETVEGTFAVIEGIDHVDDIQVIQRSAIILDIQYEIDGSQWSAILFVAADSDIIDMVEECK